MRTVNSVTLLGNIARFPERKITAGGKSFATFVIATHKETVRDGEKTTFPEFHNIVAWGNLASIAESFCQKGRLVYVEGYLKTRSWSHENGAKIFRTEIVATNIIAINNDDVSEVDSSEKTEGIELSNDSEISDREDDSFFNVSRSDFFEES